MLPVAPGANGQPPSPAIDDSYSRMPRSSPTITLARPTPRVLWKCSAMRSCGKALLDRLARDATPSAASPCRSCRRASDAVDAELRVGVDDPQRGRRPAPRLRTGSRTRMRPRRAPACGRARSPRSPRRWRATASIGALRLAWLCVSLAETKHTISSTPAPSARSAPRALGASAAMCASARRVSSASMSCASASCGTARGLTNDVASTWSQPGGDQRIDDLRP